MARPRYYGGFGNLSFPKRGREIIAKCEALRSELCSKIEERQQRIIDAAAESGMATAGDVLLNLQTISENMSGGGRVDMTVGLASKIKGELQELTKEKEEVARLELVINNLPADDVFRLDFQELEYFGFG